MSHTQRLSLPHLCWGDPNHFSSCTPCREYRHRYIELHEAKASTIANLNAVAVGLRGVPSSSHRVMSISPRLRNPSIRGIIRQTGRYPAVDTGRIPRHVTIQIPDLSSPVRTDQTPIQSPVQSPGSSYGSRKRPSNYSEEYSEPPQHYVPEQFQPVQPFVPERLNTVSFHPTHVTYSYQPSTFRHGTNDLPTYSWPMTSLLSKQARTFGKQIQNLADLDFRSPPLLRLHLPP
jgi:hypothetical protein